MAIPDYDETKLKLNDHSRPDFEAFTASDDAALLMSSGKYPVCVVVGTGGNVVLKNRNNDLVTFKNVPDGYWMKGIYPIGLAATNTTASDFVIVG